jgi:hypothetical protein
VIREISRMHDEQQLRTYEAVGHAFAGGDRAEAFVSRLNRRISKG